MSIPAIVSANKEGRLSVSECHHHFRVRCTLPVLQCRLQRCWSQKDKTGTLAYATSSVFAFLRLIHIWTTSWYGKSPKTRMDLIKKSGYSKVLNIQTEWLGWKQVPTMECILNIWPDDCADSVRSIHTSRRFHAHQTRSKSRGNIIYRFWVRSSIHSLEEQSVSPLIRFRRLPSTQTFSKIVSTCT